VCAACPTPRLNQGYELRPPWEQHLRYVPHRVRNGYNSPQFNDFCHFTTQTFFKTTLSDTAGNKESTLEQTTTAQRWRGIALLFLLPRRYMGVGAQRNAPAALYPRKKPGTHCIGSWVGPRAGLGGCGKFRPHRDSIPRPYRVAIPTELPRLTTAGNAPLNVVHNIRVQ